MTTCPIIMGTSVALGALSAAFLIGLGVAGCIPIDTDLGGSRPPPSIPDAGIIPIIDDPTDPNEMGDNAPLVFDVTIVASSLTVIGIVIEATLTAVPSEEQTENATFTQVTLRDTVNEFDGTGQTTGLNGGIFLSAAAVTPLVGGAVFELSTDETGTVSGEFRSAAASATNPNLFILQGGGQVFEPGIIGITYEIGAGSRFSFRIDGDQVTGQLDLSGTPVNEAGGLQTYIGEFSGSLRP